MDGLLAGDLLFEAHHAIRAVDVVREPELFAFKSGLASAGELALVIGRAIAWAHDLEVAAVVAAAADAHRAVGALVGLQCLPLDEVARLRSRQVVDFSRLGAAAGAMVRLASVVRRARSRLKQVDFLLGEERLAQRLRMHYWAL